MGATSSLRTLFFQLNLVGSSGTIQIEYLEYLPIAYSSKRAPVPQYHPSVMQAQQKFTVFVRTCIQSRNIPRSVFLVNFVAPINIIGLWLDADWKAFRFSLAHLI